MSLASVRLTEAGLLPSPEVAARLLEEAAAEALRRAQAEQAAASRSPAATVVRPAAGPSDLQADSAHTPSSGQPSQPHLAPRIDARPPWSHPLSRLCWCPRCQYLTGGQLQSSPVAHEIPGPIGGSQGLTFIPVTASSGSLWCRPDA
jgi:hypothetical protein